MIEKISVSQLKVKMMIFRFFRRKGDIVVFCTYQSSKKIAIALKNKNIEDFDLIIADEAHKCTGF